MYAQTSGHGFNLARIAEGFGSSISALLSTDNLNATVYSLLSAGLGLYSAVLLFGPHEVMPYLVVCASSQPDSMPF